MAKDKTYEERYRAEGERRMALRKQKRKEKFTERRNLKWGNDPDYSCPKCGLSCHYSKGSSGWNTYDEVCGNCGTIYETPDV